MWCKGDGFISGLIGHGSAKGWKEGFFVFI